MYLHGECLEGTAKSFGASSSVCVEHDRRNIISRVEYLESLLLSLGWTTSLRFERDACDVGVCGYLPPVALAHHA